MTDSPTISDSFSLDSQFKSTNSDNSQLQDPIASSLEQNLLKHLTRLKKEDSPQGLNDLEITDSKLPELIEQLGDSKFKERNSAQHKIEAMGPKVIPDLEDALKSVEDPEKRHRLNSAIDNISNKERQKEVGEYRSLAKDMTKFLEKKGFTVRKELVRDIVPAEIMPGRISPPMIPLELSNQDRETFESMIKFGDKLSEDKDHSRLMNAVIREGTSDELNTLELVQELKNSRAFFAAMLQPRPFAERPNDTKHGIKLVNEYMERKGDPKNIAFIHAIGYAVLRGTPELEAKAKAFLKTEDVSSHVNMTLELNANNEDLYDYILEDR